MRRAILAAAAAAATLVAGGGALAEGDAAAGEQVYRRCFSSVTQGWMIVKLKLHEALLLLVVVVGLFRPDVLLDRVSPAFRAIDAELLVAGEAALAAHPFLGDPPDQAVAQRGNRRADRHGPVLGVHGA